MKTSALAAACPLRMIDILSKANDLDAMSNESYWLEKFNLSNDDLFLTYDAAVFIIPLNKAVKVYLNLYGPSYRGAAVASVPSKNYLRMHASAGQIDNSLFIPKTTIRVESNDDKLSLTSMIYDQANHKVIYNERRIANLEAVLDLRDIVVEDKDNIIPAGEHINDLFSGIFNIGSEKYKKLLEQGSTVEGFAVSRDSEDNTAKPEIYVIEVKRHGASSTDLYADASKFFAREQGTIEITGKVDNHFIPLVGEI